MELFSSARTAEFSCCQPAFLLPDLCCFQERARRSTRVALLQGFIIDGDHAAPGEPSQRLGKNEKLSRLARAKADAAAIRLSAATPLLDGHDTILFDGSLQHLVVFRRS